MKIRGFSFAELLLVVGIFSVVMVLALVGYKRWNSGLRRAEVRHFLTAMANAAEAAYERGIRLSDENDKETEPVHALCMSASAAVPSNPEQIRGHHYTSNIYDWSPPADAKRNAGFPCLRYEIRESQWFSYLYLSDSDFKSIPPKFGDHYECVAHGDLNGNGKESTFRLRGTLKDKIFVRSNIEETDPKE